MLEYRDVYAGGRLVGSGSTDVITIVNPATEEVTGAVPAQPAKLPASPAGDLRPAIAATPTPAKPPAVTMVPIAPLE